MALWAAIDWTTVDWITPTIHIYAAVVLMLSLAVFYIHRARIVMLMRRVANLAARVEGRSSPQLVRVRLDQLTGLILSLGDAVDRRADRDLIPVLQFVRQEDRHGGLQVVRTLVNVTETMIELFPILGILGTVYAISAVGGDDFTSARLLSLFGTATGTTLWALFYVVVFRIGYSAFCQAPVNVLDESNLRYQELLSNLEQRSRTVDLRDHDDPVAARVGNDYPEARHP